MEKQFKVKKRNEDVVDFDEYKIYKAVESAFKSVGSSLSARLQRSLIKEIFAVTPDVISVEEIQNRIEKWLMDNKYFDACKSFILYREKHKEDRLLVERFGYMTNYISNSDNASDSSEEDSNANVSIKNVANLNGETYKALNRSVQRMWMKRSLNTLFPEVAKQYIKDLENHIIYAHDESSFSVPTNYCEAVSLYPLLLEGTSKMDGLRTIPPKNLNSFCGQLINLTFLLASQCKGAVAFGEFFNFFDYFCVKEWGEDWDLCLNNLATTPVYEKQKTVKDVIHQAFQQIVFSWNQPMGNRSFQSPFINISYYDSNYWKALFEHFVFPDGTKPVWKRINVLQRLFLNWFNETRKKTLMAFPVETMALLTDGKDVIDKEYKNLTAQMWAKGHSFFLYLSDSPDSLSSCCFAKNQMARININGKDITESFEVLFEKYGKEEELCVYHNGRWEKGKLIQLPNRQTYIITTENGATLNTSDNHLHPTQRGTIPTVDLKIGDCLKWYDDKTHTPEYTTIVEIVKSNYSGELYCFEMRNKEDPYFTLANGIITHNCRLRNQIEKNEFSFTNGLTGVKTGSCNVITLNLNRIVQDWHRTIDSPNPFSLAEYGKSLENYLKDILERVYKYHIAYKTMLYDLEKKGMLTASTAGFISMKDLYSTIGINGINEAAEFLGMKCSDNKYYRGFIRFITHVISNENTIHSTPEFKFNQEFVPAESLGSKNYLWDKENGYVVPKNRVLYNSYFYLADNPQTSVLEKLRLHGKEYTELLNGGVGCHLNLAEHLSESQYLKLIDYAIKVGCNYFTFNIPNSECEDCGHIEKIPIEECPVCKSRNITQWVRIIGYLRPIKNFDKYRRKEAETRVYSK